VNFFCPHCDAAIAAPYAWCGISIACPACARVAPLQCKAGQRVAMSASGDGITFDDFVALLNQAGWREQAQPLIAQLLACTVERRGGGFVLKDKNGALLPCEAAHLQIQADPPGRKRLYRLAMALWR
jgi:hypothetical protein